MSKEMNKRFDIVYSAHITYTLTPKDLEFLNKGQVIQVIVADKCSLIVNPPKPQENNAD